MTAMDLTSTFSTVVTKRALRRHRLRRLAGWFVAAALIVALIAGAVWYVGRPIPVEATRVVRGPAARVVYATGFVEPRRPVDVSSRVTAPVATVLVEEGSHVARGQPLALLDAEDLSQSIAELSAQTVNAEQAERRARALFDQGFLANSARDQAVATASSARAAESAARARFNQYTIRSGIAGVVLRKDVEPGDLATPSKTLFEIGDPRLLRVTATVDERDIPLVRRGAAVLMSTEAYPGRVIRGYVADITPGGDPDQRAFRVRIWPTTELDLPIGLTLEVNVVAEQHPNTLLVPAGAIRNDSVWTVEGGRARRVAVTTGIRGGSRTEITTGAAEGACIIANPPDKLKDGERVSATGC